jgi:hypothetical protein
MIQELDRILATVPGGGHKLIQDTLLFLTIAFAVTRTHRFEYFASRLWTHTNLFLPSGNKYQGKILYESPISSKVRFLMRQFVGGEPYRRTCRNRPLHSTFVEGTMTMAREGSAEEALSRFEQALELDPELVGEQREAWIKALEQGENPFTEEVLEKLRAE